jgi:RHS repeat-associated protein
VHDANGSVTGDGLNTYGYDARGRLVSAVSAAGTIGYQVNALGQRVRKTSSFGDTVFHYDAQGRLIAESTAAGAPVREYLWLGDHPVAVAAAQRLGTACPTTPQLDTSNTFRAFSPREGLEAHSGRPGARGWEWRIGTNVRRPKSSDDADLDWVSGKSYEFRLTYDGVGNASVTVRDGETELFTLTQTGGMDVGNAVRFEVRSAAGLKAGNRVQASITMIDGQVVSETLQTAGDGTLFEIGKVFAGESLKNGFVVEGTVSLTFTGPYPPRGSRLRFLVTVGSVACQGPPPATEAKLYYVHVDHLNTPRAITDESQRVVWRWENTEPFGKSPPEEDPDGDGVPFEMPLRFPGQYFDAETGLFYNYFRDYDPAIGRYIQSDPIGLRGGLNPYLYVGGNPLSFADPTGEAGPLLLALPFVSGGGASISFGTATAFATAITGSILLSSSTQQRQDPKGAKALEGPVTGQGKYYCQVRVNVYPIGECKTCPDIVYGNGYGHSPDEAWNNALASANAGVPVGCGYRHPHGVGGSCKGRIGGKAP